MCSGGTGSNLGRRKYDYRHVSPGFCQPFPTNKRGHIPFDHIISPVGTASLSNPCSLTSENIVAYIPSSLLHCLVVGS
jgi:hypothetical protein